MKNTRWKRCLLACLVAMFLSAGCGVGQPDDSDAIDSQDHALSNGASDALRFVANIAQHLAYTSGTAFASSSESWHSFSSDAPSAQVTPSEPGPSPKPQADPVMSGGGGDGSSQCYAISWSPSAPLQLTVVFNACPLPNGEELNGEATVWLDGKTLQAGASFDALSAGPHTLSGEILFSASPTAIVGTAEIDLTNSDNGGSELQLTGTIEITKNAVTIDGAGSLTQDGKTFDAKVQSARWDDLANCYPTSGTVVLEAAPEPPVSLTFVVTPQGPAVDVENGNLPPIRLALDCPL